MSIRWKLIGGALSFLLLFLAVYVATSTVTASQKADALVINIAGRQRTLAEKMTKELLAYAEEPRAENWTAFEDSKRVFDASTEALRNGGEVAVTMNPDGRSAALPGADDDQVRGQLALVASLSGRYGLASEKVKTEARAGHKAADEVVQQVPVLIGRLDRVVQRSQAAADSDLLTDEQRAEWTVVINLAARQVLLAQRIGTLALEFLRHPSEERKSALEEVVGFFDGTHTALSMGGPVFRDLNDPSITQMIPAAPDSRVQAHLLEVNDRWSGLKRALDSLEFSAAIEAKALADARELSPQLHAAMDEVVERSQTLSEAKVAMVDTVQLVALLLALVFVGVAAVLGNRLGRNVVEAVDVAETIAGGDLTHRKHVTTNDETGRLLASLNQMTDQLSTLVHQVQVSGASVDGSSSQIAGSAQRQEAAVSELASSATQIAATSTQIAATADELLATMTQVGQVSERTSRAAADSKRGLEEMHRTMAQMVESTETVTDRLDAISQKTSKIATVVGTITKIAQQTNLISLNAAIEAENAGELGLGFAVVAKEVRRLADQTAKASTGIEQMVAEMQSAVSTAVMGMDGFSEDIRSGSAAVREVVARLGRMVDRVEAIGPRFAEVREGMSAQALGAGQIADGVRQIVESSEETAESVRQTNAAIAELMNAAGELREGVQRFKVAANGS